MRRARLVTTTVAAAVLLGAVVVPTSADQDRTETLLRQLAEQAGERSQDGTRHLAEVREPQAARACWSDPTGDPEPGPYPKADLVRWCTGLTGDTVTVQLEAAQPTNPDTDPNWIYGYSGLVWGLDVHGDDTDDFLVGVINDGSRVYAEVADADTYETLCVASFQFDGTTNTTTFPTGCVDNAERLWSVGYIAYDSQWDNPDAPVYDDISDFAGGPVRADSPTSTAPPAAPDGSAEKGRLWGESRFETAARISRYEFPDGATEVYLARADTFPDALAGGSLTRGPVLLVPPCGPIPGAVLDEVRRLQPAKVIALGGTAAVCEQVLDDALAAAN